MAGRAKRASNGDGSNEGGDKMGGGGGGNCEKMADVLAGGKKLGAGRQETGLWTSRMFHL